MKRSFFLHYNKPASTKRGKVQVSVHFSGKCIIADGIDCRVPTFSRIRNTSPKFVMAGKANSVTVQDGIAVIY